jgi:hypothetical protein
MNMHKVVPISKSGSSEKVKHGKSGCAANSARWRCKNAKRIKALVHTVNLYRNKLNMPPVNLKAPHTSTKGRPKQNFLPPNEMLATMSQKELSVSEVKF